MWKAIYSAKRFPHGQTLHNFWTPTDGFWHPWCSLLFVLCETRIHSTLSLLVSSTWDKQALTCQFTFLLHCIHCVNAGTQNLQWVPGRHFLKPAEFLSSFSQMPIHTFFGNLIHLLMRPSPLINISLWVLAAYLKLIVAVSTTGVMNQSMSLWSYSSSPFFSICA